MINRLVKKEGGFCGIVWEIETSIEKVNNSSVFNLYQLGVNRIVRGDSGLNLGYVCVNRVRDKIIYYDTENRN